MYRIKKDKRIEASVARICNGLAVCMREKSFTSIGVAEIAAAAGVSRATFYRIFDTPYDVLLYLCNSLASELVRSLQLTEAAGRNDIILKVLEYLTSNADRISVVFKSGRIDLMQQALAPYSEQLVPSITSCATKGELDYARTAIASLLAGILHVWDLHGRVETADDLLAIFKKFSQKYSSQNPQ